MKFSRRIYTAFLIVLSPAAFAAPKAWVFRTPLTGALNQRLAVAERITENIEIIYLDDPNLLKPYDVQAFVREHVADPGDPGDWPDLIVHTEVWPFETDLIFGIKAAAPKPVRVVHLETPEYRPDEWDLVVNANFSARRPGPNVIHPIGVATRINPERVAAAAKTWASRLAWLRPPVTLVALGGDMDFFPYQPEWITDLARRLARLKPVHGGSLIIATSRRTPPEALPILSAELRGVPYYIYDWTADGPELNPFVAALAFANHVVVTGDSLSMLSDVLALGLPLYVHAPAWSLESRHARLIEDLYVAGYARPFVGDEARAWTYPPINVAREVADELKRRFCELRLTR